MLVCVYCHVSCCVFCILLFARVCAVLVDELFAFVWSCILMLLFVGLFVVDISCFVLSSFLFACLPPCVCSLCVLCWCVCVVFWCV